MIKCSDYIIGFLESKLNIKHIFLLPGGQAMHLLNSLKDNNKIDHVCALHEQAVAMMATVYSRATENLGAAIVTTGPGGTNSITGVASAWLDSIPCIFISGQFRTEFLKGNQDIRQLTVQGVDILDIVKPITKYAKLVDDPNQIKAVLQEAVYHATTGRPGPIWLDIPLDIQAAMIEPEKQEGYKSRNAKQNIDVEAKQIIELLNDAKRPLIFAGNGIRLAKAIPEFRKFIEKFNIPVATSIMGMDIIEAEHPLYAGRPNSFGQRAANFIFQNADVILCIGAGLDIGVTGFNYKSFAREATLIVVDVYKGELHKMNINPALGVRCDAKVLIDSLNSMEKDYTGKNQNWIETCKDWQKEYPLVLEEHRNRRDYVDLYYFMEIISAVSNAETPIIMGNAGMHFEVAVQALKVKKNQRIYAEVGIGAMGHSLPASIGVCYATGCRQTVICLTGDGGIQLNIQELQTVAGNELPIKIFVFNNGGYLNIKNMQERTFDGNYIACNAESGLKLPDIKKIAKAYGIKTAQLKTNKDLEEQIKGILLKDGPIVCEVMISPEQVRNPRLGSMVLPDGNMESSPIEDLSPKLARAEFNAHMFIKPWGGIDDGIE